MKTLFLYLTLLVCFVHGAFAQGYINFSTRVTGLLVAHVYDRASINGVEEGQLWGNTATEIPAGTQSYAGGLLTGSGYYAQLWYAVGAGQPESALVPVPGSLTTFRTNSALRGTPAPVFPSVPGVVPGTGVGTFQVRAWNNQGGTVTDYRLASISRLLNYCPF